MMTTTQELVPSVSLEALILKRNALVERLEKACQLLQEADELAENLFGTEEYRGHRLALLCYGSRREFTGPDGLADMIKEVDGRAWSHLLRESGIRSLMDAKAREEWDRAIDKNNVPPLTMETIESTFAGLFAQRKEMFERGVIAVFRGLSWDYKTNNPVMFGKRIILRYIIERWGYLNYSSCHQLDDLVRVMSILDGKPEPDSRQGVSRKLHEAGFPSEIHKAELDYFTIKGFKNGNGHLTFSRPDLVEKMNQILARHYPSALPPAREAA